MALKTCVSWKTFVAMAVEAVVVIGLVVGVLVATAR